MYAVYCWHSQGMSTRSKELLETMWNSMIGFKYNWIIECDALVEAEERSTSMWLDKFRAVFVATEEEVVTNIANVAGCSVTRNFDFLVSRELVGVVRMLTIINEFPSAPHKLVQLVLRAKREHEEQVQQVPKKLPAESGGKAKVRLDFRREEEEESVSLLLLATMPKVDRNEYEQTRL